MEPNDREGGAGIDGQRLQLGRAWGFTLIASLVLVAVVIGAIALRKTREHGDTDGFVGPQKCGKCHQEQVESWADTRMARSFEVLKPGQAIKEKETAKLDPQKDYTHDEKCLPCHTTGYGRVGGFVSLEKTPNMVGVTCEACHGAGGQYVENVMERDRPTFSLEEAQERGLHYPPKADVCRGCHNDRSPFVGADYRFEYEDRVGKGTHKHFKLIYEEVKSRAAGRSGDGG